MTRAWKTCARCASRSKRCRDDEFMKLPRTSRTWAFMRTTTILLTAVFASACFTPTEEQIVGSFDSGVDAGVTDAGAQVRMDAGPDGDATCDQSACLPTTVTFARTGVSRLLLQGDSVLALGSMYGSGLSHIDLATGSTTLLQVSPGDPLDTSGALRVQGEYVYLLTTWAGEIFGIPARVKLSGGAVESLVDSATGSGNPVLRAADVDANDYVFSTSAGFKRMRVQDLPTSAPTLLLAGTPGESVKDLRLTPTHLWWVSTTGLHRATRDGASPELMLAGDFERLRLDGDVAWASGESGLTRFEAGVGTVVITGAVTDFSVARGTAFAVQQVGTKARVVDLAGTLFVEEELGTSNPVPLSLEVSASRIALGTPSRLVVLSVSPGTSVCGCDAPAVVLPAAAATCERALCGGPLQRTEGFSAGDFSGTDFLGVFRDANAGTQQLKKVNDLSTLSFDVAQPYGDVVSDGTAVFLYASGGLYAVDASTGTSRLVLDGVYPDAYGIRPSLHLDATFVYGLSQGTLFRVARAGGSREDLATLGSYVQATRLDATHVYVMRNGTLLRVPKTGGTLEVLATGATGEAGFDLSGDHVYFGTPRGLERVRKTGGFKSLVLSHAQLGDTGFTQLTMQGREAAMFIHPATGGDRIVRVDLQTLARQDVLTLPTNATPQAVVISPRGYAVSTYDQTKLQLRDCCP
jgi:hypothetical protein